MFGDLSQPRKIGGAEGNRTPDLLNAIQALSQLSYGPSPNAEFEHRMRQQDAPIPSAVEPMHRHRPGVITSRLAL